MHRKFKITAEKLFYPEPTVKSNKKIRTPAQKNKHFAFYRILLLIPVIFIISYGTLLYFLADRVFDLSYPVIGGMPCRIIIIFSAAITFLALFSNIINFENNNFSKSRVLRSIITVICSLLSGLSAVTFLMLAFGLTPKALFICLFIPLPFACYLFFYITNFYNKYEENYYRGLIKRVPAYLLFFIFILCIDYTVNTVTKSPDEALQNILRPYKAVHYILTEEKYTLSFGTKNITEKVSLELTDGKATSLTNYEAKCSSKGFIHLNLSEEETAKNDVLDLNELSLLSRLSDLWLENIPYVKNISSLQQIEELKIENCKIETPQSIMQNLKELGVSDSQIAYRDFINKTPFLTYLLILPAKENSDIDIKDFSSLKHLETVQLFGVTLSNPDAFEKFNKLSYISIRTNNLMKPNIKLSKECLGHIETLFLSNAELVNYSSTISSMKNLKELSIKSGDFSDISALKDLNNLEYVSLQKNNIKDISALANKTNIRTLNLSDNRIRDISAVSSLKNLESIYIYNNEIEDILPLSNLYNLKKIDMSNNKISVVPYLSSKNILRIDLRNNNVSDLSGIVDCENLEYLDITENPISEEQLDMFSDNIEIYFWR